MSQSTASTPGLTAAESGSLVLTDISGYTGYLLGTELEHAQDVLSDLMAVVVGTLQPPLRVTKLEGDAIFSYALDGACGASTLLDSIERSYFAFRSRQRDIAHATSCTCDACKQIPTLDLKFIVHHGSFVRRELAGNEELTGRAVIVLHRLSKNSAADVLGTKGYVLLTDECMEALHLDGEALGMQPHVESYDDVGEVPCCLEDLGERWQAEAGRTRLYVEPEGASFELTFTVPVDPTVVWDWMTAAEKRVLYAADDVTSLSPGGRERPGVTNHCMHGPDVVVEHIVDWHPFDYFTKSYEFPGVGPMNWTFDLADNGGSTTVSVRGEPLSGDRKEAWAQLEADLLAGLEHTGHALSEQMARIASGAEPRSI
jgi:uncharacterized protein YndB with AHSA1/START domain